jgi:hypothetical protein
MTRVRQRSGREKEIAKRLDRWLAGQPRCWQLNVHGSQYQRPGVPDRLISWQGHFVAVEIKRPDGPGPSPIQRHELERIALTGGLAIVARSVEDVQKAIAAAFDGGKWSPPPGIVGL